MVFRHLEYRKAVVELVERRKAIDKSASYQRLAEATGIQATYVSNVLAGRAHFSADQLFLIARFLNLPAEEGRYLLLLLDHERCQVAARKAELRKEIETWHAESRKTKKHLQAAPAEISDLAAAEYYLDPLVVIVHVALRLSRFAKNPTSLASEFGVTTEHLSRTLQILERLGYVKAKGASGYEVLVSHRHLPNDSPVCLPHQAQMRVKTVEHMYRTPASRRHHVSVTFSSDEETKNEVHRRFLRFLQEAEGLVRKAKDEQVYQLNFDLFPWSLRY